MSVDSLDPCGVYLGTTGGRVYASADAGDTWAPIVRDLSDVQAFSLDHQATQEHDLTSKIGGAMGSPATTRLSSKGQVVIPEEIRDRLGLKEGTQFVVVGERDVVILKLIAPPAMQEFDELMRRARGAARKSGMKPTDIRRAVTKARAPR
jgi:AbrB family looped-hinge helix DNA binding protein